MNQRRELNKQVFQDTVSMYEHHPVLTEVVRSSIQNQKIILEQNEVEFTCTNTKAGKVIVSGKRSFEASQVYASTDKKVCVLNFASACNPGGGVVNGASAQEEALCRCSTLYPCLNTNEMWQHFYLPHRKYLDSYYNNDCVYIPKVKVFKSDTNNPQVLEENLWYDVDIITCAATNLRNVETDAHTEAFYQRLRKLFLLRIERIFQIAIANQVDVLILGAFGCGAFCNPPHLVADVFKEMTLKYRYNFDVIEYAIYHRHYELENYQAFEQAMNGLR